MNKLSKLQKKILLALPPDGTPMDWTERPNFHDEKVEDIVAGRRYTTRWGKSAALGDKYYSKRLKARYSDSEQASVSRSLKRLRLRGYLTVTCNYCDWKDGELCREHGHQSRQYEVALTEEGVEVVKRLITDSSLNPL